MRKASILFILFLLLVSCDQIPDSITVHPSPMESLVAEPPTIQPSFQASSADPTLPTPDYATYRVARESMVQRGIVEWGIADTSVIAVMGEVPRHEFVPSEYLPQAYENYPLPIGYGQTISQPYIVALMTQELDVTKGDRVLEIGTGSGYQAAVLAELGVEVFTIEIIGPLYELATERLQGLDYKRVTTRHGDGYYGWEEESPYDAIIVTAAPDHVPQPLLAQLKVGGVMVIPVGPIGSFQELWRIIRIEEDTFQSASLGGVTFVPFTRLGETP